MVVVVPGLLLAWNIVGIVLALVLTSLPKAWRGIRNDFLMLYGDPALGSWLEGLVAYPGFWALFWYRLSHVLWRREVPLVSTFVPRLVMSIVRYCTAVDIHPAAVLSEGGLLLDHATGIVVGATAEVGARTTIYHQVTLGATGKAVGPGEKRHPTVGDDCVIGAGAKILGPITVGSNCAVGANSVVTKAVPDHTTVVGIPARAVGREKPMYRTDPGTEALYNLHVRLSLLESQVANNSSSSSGGSSSGGGNSPTVQLVRHNNTQVPGAQDDGDEGVEEKGEDRGPAGVVRRSHTPPPTAICEQLMAKLRGLQEEDKRHAVGRYWRRLASDKSLCFASLNSVLGDSMEASPETESSLASAML